MKTIKIILFSILIIFMLSNDIFAFAETIGTGKKWLKDGLNEAPKTMNTEALKNGSNDLYNMFLAAATGVAIIVRANISY